MSKAILMSIRPKWCSLILNGDKTVEVRKNRPRIEPPFKVYIYCTKGKPNDPNERLELHSWDKDNEVHITHLNGKVVGEFTCNKIEDYDSALSEWAYAVAPPGPESVMPMHESTAIEIMSEEACMSFVDIHAYFPEDIKAYFWYISDLVVYDEPKELSEFTGLRKTKFGYEPIPARPPQSWGYVEDL